MEDEQDYSGYGYNNQMGSTFNDKDFQKALEESMKSGGHNVNVEDEQVRKAIEQSMRH